MQRSHSLSHLPYFIFSHIFPFQHHSFSPAICTLLRLPTQTYPLSSFLPKHSGRLRGSFVATLCGRLGQALRSDTYAGFREGQLTLVNIAEVSGYLKVALPTLRKSNPGACRVPLPKIWQETLFNYSSLRIAIPSSSSCFSSTRFGASVIRQDASFTFGNAITSRILSCFAISITRRSRP